MKWEYLIVENPKDTEVSEYGERGWELVAVTNNKGFIRCYFKKPKN